MQDYLGPTALVALFVLAIVITLLWIFLPFAVFGFQKKMDEQIALQTRTNQLLKDLLIHQSELSGLELEQTDTDMPLYGKKFRDADQVKF